MKQERKENGLEQYQREKKEEAEERRRKWKREMNNPESESYKLEKQRQENSRVNNRVAFIIVGIFIAGTVLAMFGWLGPVIVFTPITLYIFRRRIFGE